MINEKLNPYHIEKDIKAIDKEVFEFLSREDYKKRLNYLKRCMELYRAKKELK